MKGGRKKIIFLYALLIIFFIVNQLANNLYISYLIGCLATLVLIFSIRKASRLYRSIGIFFLISGLIIWWFFTPLGIDILLHFDSLLGLMALFFVLPFMNTVIKVGRYDQTLRNIMLNNSSHVPVLYRKMSFTTYILTIFLNIATVPIILSTVQKRIESFGDKTKTTFLSTGILRAYSLVLLWSPTDILVAVTIDVTNQNYLRLLPILFGSSLIFLFLDWQIHRFKYKNLTINEEVETNPAVEKLFKKKMTELILAIMLIVVTIIVLNQFTTQGFLFIVTISIFPLSFIWALLIRQKQRFLKLGLLSVQKNESSLHGLFFLFLSAGLFVEMMPYTAFFDNVNLILVNVYENYSLFFFYLIVGLFIFILSLVGFHPLISIALLIPFLQGFIDELGFGLAITIVSAAISTIMVGPFNITPTVLAVSIGRSPYYVISKNLLFGFGFLVTNVLIAYILTILLT